MSSKAPVSLILFALVMAIGPVPFAWGSPAVTDRPVVHILTDIHYLAEGLHDDGSAFRKFVHEGDGKNTELIHEILEAYRLGLEKAKPDILLVTGDLTLNGEKASHLELATWFDSLESLGVKVLVLPGNHDILNPWARGFSKDRAYITDSITPEEFRALYRDCGYGEAIARDKESLSYIAAPVPGLWIFMLDSTIHSDNMLSGHPEAGGGFGDGTLAWIGMNREKARQAGAVVLVAMHHNMVDHNLFISDGYTVFDAETVRDRFTEAGIDFVLTGHVHVQDISELHAPSGTFHDIATNALSVYPHHYGRVIISPRQRLLSYQALPVDVEAWARAKGNGDDRLTGFRAYSERFFRDCSAFMVGRMLSRREVPLPRPRATAMTELFGTLNARFFAGNSFLNANDTVNTETYRDLVTTDYGFLSSYARSIIEDPSPENNRLEISY